MNPTLKLYQQSRAQDRMNLARDPLIGGIIDRPGGGGGAVDWSVFAFGCSVVGDVAAVNAGAVMHADHYPVGVTGASLVLTADHQYIWIEYDLSGHSGGIAGPSTVEPYSDAQTFRVWLTKFRLVDGVGSIEQIGHVGNIIIPSIYE